MYFFPKTQNHELLLRRSLRQIPGGIVKDGLKNLNIRPNQNHIRLDKRQKSKSRYNFRKHATRH